MSFIQNESNPFIACLLSGKRCEKLKLEFFSRPYINLCIIKSTLHCFILFLTVLIFPDKASFAQTAKSPAEFFGFEPGLDRNLFDYDQLIAYFKQLEEASPRIMLKEIGETPMGKKIYLVFISSSENLAKPDRYKNINRKSALYRQMTDSERDSLNAEDKGFCAGDFILAFQ
ncbi:MAG: hypothetical protein Q7U54_13115 [Bacteroidales bacterium]|nr:hypothetical protein [Bacteroidales bacterium]